MRLLRRKITEEVRANVIDLYSKGLPYKNIATEVGLATGTVSTIVNHYRKNTGQVEVDEAKILALWISNMRGGRWTIRDIAYECKCSEETVRDVLLDKRVISIER